MGAMGASYNAIGMGVESRDLDRVGDLWGRVAEARADAPVKGWADPPIVIENVLEPRLTPGRRGHWLVGVADEVPIPRGGRWASLGCGSAGTEVFAAGKGLGQPGQRAERARHPDAFACRTRVEADAPAQPSGARAEAVAPAAARIELADEIEEASGRRIEVSRQLSDLVAQAIQLRGALRRGLQRGGKVRPARVHGEFPFRLGRLYTPISPPSGCHQAARIWDPAGSLVTGGVIPQHVPAMRC